MGRGHALWLLPEPSALGRLSAVIAQIARAEGSPRFEPHVTLLSGITLEAGDVIERARTLAAIFTPMDVLLARAAQRPEFFQAELSELQRTGQCAVEAVGLDQIARDYCGMELTQ